MRRCILLLLPILLLSSISFGFAQWEYVQKFGDVLIVTINPWLYVGKVIAEFLYKNANIEQWAKELYNQINSGVVTPEQVQEKYNSFDVIGWYILPNKPEYLPGENITVVVGLRLPDLPNDVHDMQYIEVAILPRYYIEQWFGPVAIPQYYAERAQCDPYQPNFAGVFVERQDSNPTRDPWIVKLEAKLIIPYPGMRTPPTGEKYWLGPGDYYIVVYSTNGCWKDLAPLGQYKVYGWKILGKIRVVSPEYEETEETSTTQTQYYNYTIINDIINKIYRDPIVLLLLGLFILILLLPSPRKEAVKVIVVPIEKVKEKLSK